MAISEVKHIPEHKIRKVEEIKEILDKYPVIGLTHISQIGSSMLQTIRKKLRGKIGIKIIKNNLLKIALKEVQRENISKLIDHIDGSTALVYTDENPFKLKLDIEKNRSLAYAKAGTITPKDIIIKEGDTGFPPGSVITELNEVGLKTRIKGGSVYIQETKVVAKEGEVISPMLAIVLSRLNIRPIELGLDLYAAYDGDVYTSEDLKINIEEILTNLNTAINQATNLAVYIAYPTPSTIIPIIQKAYTNAKGLVLQTGIIVDEFINELIALANLEAVSLANEIIKKNPDALPKELVESLSSGLGESKSSDKSASPKDKSKDDDAESSKPKKDEEDSSLGIGNLFG
ncbi:MAG: 50S ribosomal protein L10 [Candidatus Helarchaeota archaeon]